MRLNRYLLLLMVISAVAPQVPAWSAVEVKPPILEPKESASSPVLTPTAGASTPQKQVLTLSLKEATTRALSGSHVVKKAKEDYSAAREATSASRAAFLPSVRFDSDVGTLHDREPSFGDLTPAKVARDRNQYDAQFVLTQPLFSGFHGVNDLRAKNAAMVEQEWKLKTTALDMSTQVIELYFGLQLAQANLEAEQQVAKLREEQLEDVRSRLKQGRATELDVLESEYAVSAQDPNIKTLEREIKSKSLQLARLIALPLDQGFTLSDALSDVGAILGSAKLPNLADAYAISMKESPKLRAAEQTRERIELEYARDSSKHYPDLSFEAIAGYKSNLRADFATEDSRHYSGILKLSVPLFSGLSSFDENRVNQAKIASAQEDVGLARDDVLQQLTDAYGDLELAESKVTAEKKNTELTQKAVDNAKILFRGGRATQTSVLDSYSRDLAARKNYAQALHDRIMALAKIRTLTSP